jgi:hypothetical protein
MYDYNTLENLQESLPDTVSLIILTIIRNRGLSEDEAIERLYSSELYSQLDRVECRLWPLSHLCLYQMFCEEQDTGHITYPEEQ